MKRLALFVLVLGFGAAPAHAATKTYSSGSINAAIGSAFERSVVVRDHGPVSYVNVLFRISAPVGSALTLSLRSPSGKEVPLVVKRGDGPDFGNDKKACYGTQTVVDSDWTDSPISKGKSPFVDNPYAADGQLSRFYGEKAHGRWTLVIANTGAAARLHCFELTLSRDVPTTILAARAGIRTEVSYVERNYQFERTRVTIVRHGKTVLSDAPLARLRCRDCDTFRPTGITIKDLDGGEPEVIVELFTGGAHCCASTLILRWNGAKYEPAFFIWGNYGYEFDDLDGDGRPEISAFDERFVYRYTSYVDSAAPIQIWHYENNRVIDVTRDYHAVVLDQSRALLRDYQGLRKEQGAGLRGYAAAYVASLYLLDRQADAKTFLDTAVARGDFADDGFGEPVGKKFVALLLKDLKELGYA